MFLDYETYKNMGGTLEQSAFNVYNRRSEYMVRSQAAGQTGQRIDNLAEIPAAVKDCIFDLILLMSSQAFGKGRVSSESQTLGGQSESKSYEWLTSEQLAAEYDDIIYNSFYGAGIGELLYRGFSE